MHFVDGNLLVDTIREMVRVSCLYGRRVVEFGKNVGDQVKLEKKRGYLTRHGMKKGRNTSKLLSFRERTLISYI